MSFIDPHGRMLRLPLSLLYSTPADGLSTLRKRATVSWRTSTPLRIHGVLCLAGQIESALVNAGQGRLLLLAQLCQPGEELQAGPAPEPSGQPFEA